jgi:hypothetical protein
MRYLKIVSLTMLVISIPVSGLCANCPNKLTSIQLNKLKSGTTFTESGYKFRLGQRGDYNVAFEPQKLWDLMSKNGAIYTVTLSQDVGSRPGTADCIYQVKEGSTAVTKLVIHGQP